MVWPHWSSKSSTFSWAKLSRLLVYLIIFQSLYIQHPSFIPFWTLLTTSIPAYSTLKFNLCCVYKIYSVTNGDSQNFRNWRCVYFEGNMANNIIFMKDAKDRYSCSERRYWRFKQERLLQVNKITRDVKGIQVLKVQKILKSIK